MGSALGVAGRLAEALEATQHNAQHVWAVTQAGAVRRTQHEVSACQGRACMLAMPCDLQRHLCLPGEPSLRFCMLCSHSTWRIPPSTALLF